MTLALLVPRVENHEDRDIDQSQNKESNAEGLESEEIQTCAQTNAFDNTRYFILA